MKTMMLGNIPYEFSDKLTNTPVGLKYITAKNGNFEVRDNNVLQIVAKYETELIDLPAVKEGINFKLPKIPFSMFSSMYTFFKAVYLRDKTESSLFLFFNKKMCQYILWAPKQENSTAASTYERGTDPEYIKMCTDNTLVMMAHSHPWKGTTVHPSGIDNNDEKDSILYLVVGNVEENPNVYLSTCPGGNRKKLPFFSFFENPILLDLAAMEADSKVVKFIYEKLDPNDTEYVFKNYLEEMDNPAEWLTKAKPRATALVTTYTSGKNNKANYYLGEAGGGYNIWDDYDSTDYTSRYEHYMAKDEVNEEIPEANTLANILLTAPDWLIAHCKTEPKFLKFLKGVN